MVLLSQSNHWIWRMSASGFLGIVFGRDGESMGGSWGDRGRWDRLLSLSPHPAGTQWVKPISWMDPRDRVRKATRLQVQKRETWGTAEGVERDVSLGLCEEIITPKNGLNHWTKRLEIKELQSRMKTLIKHLEHWKCSQTGASENRLEKLMRGVNDENKK